MKARVNVYQDKNGQPTYPPALANMRQYYLGHITTVMRMYGIGHITMRPVQTGLRVTPQISFRPMPVSPTDDMMLAARPDVVRRLAEDMMLMGIVEVELNLDAGDDGILKESWARMATAQPQAQGQPQSNNIPLNIETDPTAQPVPVPDASPMDAEEDVKAEAGGNEADDGAIEIPGPPAQ